MGSGTTDVGGPGAVAGVRGGQSSLPRPGLHWQMLRALLLPVPALLVAGRGLCVPLLPVLAMRGEGELLALVILLGTLSDIFDGIIARRLGIAGERLRRADSMVDLAFWLATLGALCILRPAEMADNLPVIAAGLLAELVQQGISLIRFRRLTATHARSAKIFGLCLMAGFILLALGGSSSVAFWIIAKGIAISALDGILIVLLLPRWEADIPDAYAAWQRRRGRPITRHWLW